MSEKVFRYAGVDRERKRKKERKKEGKEKEMEGEERRVIKREKENETMIQMLDD